MVLGETHLHRVYGETDVCGVLARIGAVGNLDQLDAQLVHRRHCLIKALPVAIGALHDDAPLLDKALEDALYVWRGAWFLMATTVALASAKSKILVVDEHGNRALRSRGDRLVHFTHV